MMDQVTTKVYLIHREFMMKRNNCSITEYNKIFNTKDMDVALDMVTKEYQTNGSLAAMINATPDNEMVEFLIHIQNELDRG